MDYNTYKEVASSINIKEFQYGTTIDQVHYGKLVPVAVDMLESLGEAITLFDLCMTVKALLGVADLNPVVERRLHAGLLLAQDKLPKCPFCGQLPTVDSNKEFVNCGPACPIGDRWIEIEDWCARDPEGTEGLYIL